MEFLHDKGGRGPLLPTLGTASVYRHQQLGGHYTLTLNCAALFVHHVKIKPAFNSSKQHELEHFADINCYVE